MKFKKGMRIEVLNRKEELLPSWWPAEIISGNGHTYLVRYGRHPEDSAVLERVPRKAIRPCPSEEGLGSWAAGDIVEVFSDWSWKLAEVSRIGYGDHYFVTHIGSQTEIRVNVRDIRARQAWQDDDLMVILKDCGRFGDRTTSKQWRKGKLNKSPGNSLPSSEIKKRPSGVLAGGDKTRPSKKIRATERRGTYNGVVAGSPQLLHKKVDAVVYPPKVLGEKYMHASLNNKTGFSVARQWEEIHIDDHSDSRSRLESRDTESVSSSVGSCSASDSPYRTHWIDGLVPDLDNSSDCESSSRSERELCFSSKEALAENIHQLELNAYRTTLLALYASGPISWDQEAMMTSLRLMLHISNDEHLVELRNLISSDRNASFR